MNVDSFGGSFTAFNFGLGKATSILKTQNPNIVSDGNPNVLYENPIEFHETLNKHKYFMLDSLKHEHCSQQYSVRHVFMCVYIYINCYRQQGDFRT